MAETVFNIHAARAHLSQLVAPAEKGERITIARAGKPVAQLVPAAKPKRRRLRPDDPLLNLDKFGFNGPWRQTQQRGNRPHRLWHLNAELEITEALTADCHFIEAGFRSLLPVS